MRHREALRAPVSREHSNVQGGWDSERMSSGWGGTVPGDWSEKEGLGPLPAFPQPLCPCPGGQ